MIFKKNLNISLIEANLNGLITRLYIKIKVHAIYKMCTKIVIIQEVLK